MNFLVVLEYSDLFEYIVLILVYQTELLIIPYFSSIYSFIIYHSFTIITIHHLQVKTIFIDFTMIDNLLTL